MLKLSLAIALSLGVIVSQLGTPAPAQETFERLSGSTTASKALTSAAREGDGALDRGDYATAENLFFQGIKNFNTTGADAAKAMAELHLGYGEALLWEGKIQQASPELLKVLPQIQKAFGPNSPQYARALDSAAWLYQALGKSAKAEDYCRQALTLRRQILGLKDPDVAQSLEHLGEILEDKGAYDEAASSFEQALAIRRGSAGHWSICVANDLEELAGINQRRGKFEEATTMLTGALQLKEMRDAPLKPLSFSSTDEAVIFRFLSGASNCSRKFANGTMTESIAANGVTVQASLQRNPSNFVKYCQATVTIINGAPQPINILTQPPTLISLTPKIAVLSPLSSNQLAQTIEKKGQKKAKWINFWGADATTPVTTTVMGSYAPYGYIPPVYGYIPPCFGCQPFYNGGGMTTITTNVPDYQARQRAMEKANQAINQSTADADVTRQSALGPSSVAAGSQLTGTLNFEDSKFTKALLRIPVGDATFEFMFDQ